MTYLWYSTFLLLLQLTLISTEDLQKMYYSDVTMGCNETNYNFTSVSTIRSKYWLLPNGKLATSLDNDRHYQVNQTSNELSIKRIDDDDFGKFYCIIVREDYTLDYIEHGLNLNGPYYGDLLEHYRKNAMIGGIAAASLFVLLVGSCLVYHFRYHRRNERNKAVDELDKAIDGYDLRAYDNVGLEKDGEAEAVPDEGDEKM